MNNSTTNLIANNLVDLDFNIDKEFTKRFTGTLEFTNNGDGFKGWTIGFTAPFEITKLQGAEIVYHKADRYVIRHTGSTRVVDPGEITKISFSANKMAGDIMTPRNFTMYGRVPLSSMPTDPGNGGELPTDGGIDNPQPGTGQFRYGEALQKSFLFFEANRSGDLPEDNRIVWRGDANLQDGSDVGRDLTGGYFDAGDHVKFGLPMSANSTMLAWGGIEYKDAYKKAGQWDEILDAVKWGTDYFLKAHVSEGGKTKELYVQVGDGHADHQYFGPPETQTTPRPSFKIDAAHPGSDVAAQTAAALASASMLFRGVDNAYADKLLDNAKQLFEFADTYKGKYSDSVQAANPFYTSFSGYWDELSEAGAWLYKATGEQQYLDKAEQAYSQFGSLGNWTWIADNKSYSAALLLAQESSDSKYKNQLENALDKWIYGTDGIQKTAGGLSWFQPWGSLAMSSSTAFIAELYNDTVRQDAKYTNFNTEQIDYILGDNPRNSSYVIGFGNNYPQQPHHRGATGNAPYGQASEHVLYGALVGGPKSTNDFDYNDDRNDWIGNEVGTGYNAPLTSALIQAYDNLGGDPLSERELDALAEIDVAGI
jgi:hypothetical protein